MARNRIQVDFVPPFLADMGQCASDARKDEVQFSCQGIGARRRLADPGPCRTSCRCQGEEEEEEKGEGGPAKRLRQSTGPALVSEAALRIQPDSLLGRAVLWYCTYVASDQPGSTDVSGSGRPALGPDDDS